MMKTLGPSPLRVISCTKKQKYFYKEGLVWDENSSDGPYEKNCKSLKSDMLQDSLKHLQLFDLMRRVAQGAGAEEDKEAPPGGRSGSCSSASSRSPASEGRRCGR